MDRDNKRLDKVSFKAKQDKKSEPPHRYYSNEYPVYDELVLVRIVRIENMGAYVNLIEYGDKEGMLMLSEFSAGSLRSSSQFIKNREVFPVVVVRVDEQKGYIDLTKRRVNENDLLTLKRRCTDSRKVDIIVRATAEKVHGTSVNNLYREVIWTLGNNPAYQHSLEGLMKCGEDAEAIFAHVDRSKISQEAIDFLIAEVKATLLAQCTTLEALVELSCLGYDGVRGVMKAITHGEYESNKLLKGLPAKETERCELTFRALLPAKYRIVIKDPDNDRCFLRMSALLEGIYDKIVATTGGYFGLLGELTFSGQDDDELLIQLSKPLELFNSDESDDSDADLHIHV